MHITAAKNVRKMIGSLTRSTVKVGKRPIKQASKLTLSILISWINKETQVLMRQTCLKWWNKWCLCFHQLLRQRWREWLMIYLLSTKNIRRYTNIQSTIIKCLRVAISISKIYQCKKKTWILWIWAHKTLWKDGDQQL